MKLQNYARCEQAKVTARGGGGGVVQVNTHTHMNQSTSDSTFCINSAHNFPLLLKSCIFSVSSVLAQIFLAWTERIFRWIIC